MTAVARPRLLLALTLVVLSANASLVGCGEHALDGVPPLAGGSGSSGSVATAGAGQGGQVSGGTSSLPQSGSGGGGSMAGASCGGAGGQGTSAGTSSGGQSGYGGAGGGGGDVAGGSATAGETAGGSAPVGGAAGSSGAAGAGAGGASGQNPTTIWIAGDSTVMTYAAGNTQGNGGTSLEGWGQELAPFFNANVAINNQAIGGRSVAMFMWVVAADGSGAPLCRDDQGTPEFKLSNGSKIDSPQWARIKAGIKAGDFLLVQFGHNDETHTCPRFVNTADYATYLGFMAETAIAKGATPIFVTPMGHRSFTGSKFNNTLLPYAESMKAAAQLKSLQVIDLNLRSGEYYEGVGNAFLATNIFDGGTTHFIKAGAVRMATLIVGELEKQGGPLAAYLK